MPDTVITPDHTRRLDDALPPPSFFAVRHLAFVNWYAFFKEDLEIHGRTAFLGHNGAGKSAILDGMYTLLTGNPSRLRLNASAQNEEISKSSKKRRTVRDYCLGAIDDVDSEGENDDGGDGDGVTLLRDQAISYVLMGFERTDTRRQVTIGICLTAHKQSAKEDTEALFIVEGRLLTTDDVAEGGVNPDGTVWSDALPWDEVRARLDADPTLTVHVRKGPELFVAEVCKILGPELGSMDRSRFLKNLRNALAFQPVTSPTDFVRNYILDQQPVSVAKMRESIARYAEIEKVVEALENRLRDAEGLHDKYTDIQRRRQLYARRRVVSLQSHLHLAVKQSEADVRSLAAAEKRLAGLRTEVADLQQTHRTLTDRLDQLKAAHAQSEVAKALAEIDLAVGRLTVERSGKVNDLAHLRRLIQAVAVALPFVPEFSADLAERFESVRTLVVQDVPAVAMVAAALIRDGLVERMAAALEAVQRRLAAARATLTGIEQQIDALNENIRRVEAGKSMLSGRTQRLMRLLEESGIESVPLCELVTSVDETWRRAAEAALGERREALIVDPVEYEAALAVLRHADRNADVDGALIINTTKTDETRSPKPRSLAMVIHTEHRHARAFLDYALGGIMMVCTEAELRQEDTAITADLMHTAGRATRRMRTPSPFLLGRVNTGGLMDDLRAELAAAETHQKAQATTIAQLTSVETAFSRVVIEAGDADADGIDATLAAIARIGADLETLKADRVRIAAEDISGLGEQIEATARNAQTVASQLETVHPALGRAEAAVEVARTAAEASATLVQRLRSEAPKKVAEFVRFLPASESASLAALFAEGDPGEPPPERVLNNSESAEIDLDLAAPDWLPKALLRLDNYVLVRNRKNLDGAMIAFLMAAPDYLGAYGLNRPDFVPPKTQVEALAETSDDFDSIVDKVGAWLADETADLRDNELRQKRDEAKTARLETIEAFKNDFVGKMRGAFDAIDGLLEELNLHLRQRTFHGLRYRFGKKESPNYRDMIALINRSSDPVFDLPLFGSADAKDEDCLDPETAGALRRLQAVAVDPDADISDIEDPRRYFEFKLEMLSSRDVVKTDLAKRIGTASGGQLQVPFYLAIGAALAATCYPSRKSRDGGIGLALFDEAFSKMDAAVVDEVLTFNDAVGLQTIIAAPDKERPTLEQLMETIVTVSRMDKSVMLDVQYVKPYTHARFRAENPRLIGFEAFKREAETAAAPDGEAPAGTATDTLATPAGVTIPVEVMLPDEVTAFTNQPEDAVDMDGNADAE
ncbi:SbcC/MukB-like Walker B domain-containing protein [Azospirillum sp.]|uniref:SbcC/MukB-like Walker B domain-containing protein n=1 Tax=Azospirillum sp. TaxID=34012 RepID=UPI002D44F6C7|nr:SbcC/MukB-like Walker B domain-containing protein [Azospirillum sp.]HYD64166.1 SbcC/MukB-like Walker B domain-containing protein [Azospirillum sp.]